MTTVFTTVFGEWLKHWGGSITTVAVAALVGGFGWLSGHWQEVDGHSKAIMLLQAEVKSINHKMVLSDSALDSARMTVAKLMPMVSRLERAIERLENAQMRYGISDRKTRGRGGTAMPVSPSEMPYDMDKYR
ncbi:MAG: hypothetical protein ACR2P5_02325 [Gammaproteobacteria bacterium]